MTKQTVYPQVSNTHKPISLSHWVLPNGLTFALLYVHLGHLVECAIQIGFYIDR